MKIRSSIYRWLLPVAAGWAALSCDVLDIMQDNKLSVSNMWKTSVQVEGSTYGIYSALRSNFVKNQVNVFYWGELRVGEYMWGPSPLFNVWVGRDVIQNKLTATTESTDWSQLYSAIDQANAVLKYAPVPSIPMTDAKRNWALGQAYFARAYAYFWAVRLWGDVPLNLLPIESVDQPETYPFRAPKADVYAQIGSDIESALALSDALGSDKYLATKTAVLMLKAEYSLWMYAAQKGGDAYLEGAEDALGAIGISSSLLCDKYSQIFDRMADNAKPVKNSKEIVFALYNDQTESKTGGYGWYFALPEHAVANQYQGNPVPIRETQWLTYGQEYLAKLRDSRRQAGRHPCGVESRRRELRHQWGADLLLPQVHRRHEFGQDGLRRRSGLLSHRAGRDDGCRAEVLPQGLCGRTQVVEHHCQTCLREGRLLYRCLAGGGALGAGRRVFSGVSGRGRDLVGADPPGQDLGLQRLSQGEPLRHEHPAVADFEVCTQQELESHADRGMVLTSI